MRGIEVEIPFVSLMFCHYHPSFSVCVGMAGSSLNAASIQIPHYDSLYPSFVVSRIWRRAELNTSISLLWTNTMADRNTVVLNRRNSQFRDPFDWRNVNWKILWFLIHFRLNFLGDRNSAKYIHSGWKLRKLVMLETLIQNETFS